jgi:D-3-phosphoglycerate dehydrogenase / 2-oxoglutarate reductase
VLVSLSNSDLFDETALAQALIDGPMAAAWMDSLSPGALDAERPLSRAATLQVTPRVGGLTQSSRLRGAWAVAKRVDELLQGRAEESRAAAQRPTAPDASADPASEPGSA